MAQPKDRDGKGDGTMTNDAEARRHIEAILMVAEGPVPEKILAEVLEMPVTEVLRVLQELAESYESEGRGFCIRNVAGGWRYFSHADEEAYVENFVRADQRPRLSPAALESLAIIAYKQPVSRAQLSAIRGVNCEGVVRSLMVRGLIEEVGRDTGPGQAVLYGTTTRFLEQMGLRELSALPELAQFAPEPGTAELVEATLKGQVTAAGEGDESSADLASPEGSEAP